MLLYKEIRTKKFIIIKLEIQMPKYKEFFIVFRDTETRDPNTLNEETKKIEIENILSSIHYNLGLKYKIAGTLSTFSLWLIRNIPGEGDNNV